MLLDQSSLMPVDIREPLTPTKIKYKAADEHKRPFSDNQIIKFITYLTAHCVRKKDDMPNPYRHPQLEIHDWAIQSLIKFL